MEGKGAFLEKESVDIVRLAKLLSLDMRDGELLSSHAMQYSTSPKRRVYNFPEVRPVISTVTASCMAHRSDISQSWLCRSSLCSGRSQCSIIEVGIHVNMQIELNMESLPSKLWLHSDKKYPDAGADQAAAAELRLIKGADTMPTQSYMLKLWDIDHLTICRELRVDLSTTRRSDTGALFSHTSTIAKKLGGSGAITARYGREKDIDGIIFEARIFCGTRRSHLPVMANVHELSGISCNCS